MSTTAYTCPNPTWCITDHAEEHDGEHVCDNGIHVLCKDKEGKAVVAEAAYRVVDDDVADASGPSLPGWTDSSVRIGTVGPRFGYLEEIKLDRDQLRVLIERLQALERQLGE